MGYDHPRTKDTTGTTPLQRMWMGCITLAMMTALMVAAGTSAVREMAPASLSLGQRTSRVVLYVQDAAELTLKDDTAGRVDQVNYAFALIENGEASGKHWQGIREMASWLRSHPEVDGVLSVGGWGAEGFSDAASTAEGRQKLAESMLRLMDANGFVGIDVDWEYPGSSAAGIASREEDVENWYALLALLRQGLDARQEANGRDYLLSVALGAGAEQVASVDGARLNGLVDQAVVMAYDLRGFDRQTGHHAGLYPSSEETLSGAWAVNAYEASGLADGKLLLGIPAYGRVWRRVPGENDGLHQRAETSGNKAISFTEAESMQQAGAAYHFDEEAQAAWLYDGSSFVSYEDEASVAAKAAWLQESHLLGAAVWSLGQDPEEVLLTALNDALTVPAVQEE